MNNMSLGIIYLLKKQDGRSVDTKINQFLNEYTHCDYIYSRGQIDGYLRDTISNYICNCDNPKKEIKRYFDTFNQYWIDNDYTAMINFIIQIDVKVNGMYVNGFKDNPFRDYRAFKDY